MRILGIDPGFGTLGWAVIDDTPEMVACGSIETAPGGPIEDRLLEIHRSLTGIIATYEPSAVAVERLFFARNTTTAIDVAKAIGVVLLTVRLAGLECAEYTPLQVKQAITGYGRAEKAQVQAMVMKILRIKELNVKDDAADALSIATCHSFSLPGRSVLGRVSR